MAVEPAQRLRRVGEIAREMLAGDVAVVDRLDRPALVFLDAAALLDPFDARALEALLDVDGDIVVGIEAGRIVDRQRRLAGTTHRATISRSGTRRSGAASGTEKILREPAIGPVVTFGVARSDSESGLFMAVLSFLSAGCQRL